MNRKQFILASGATCQNWTWSWSFVNTADRTVIFGAWDVYDEGTKVLILSEDWEFSRKGKKQPGYPQSREHIRLVENEGYVLRTFVMIQGPRNESDPTEPAKIERFVPKLFTKKLLRVGRNWYACDEATSCRITEELSNDEIMYEGAARTVSINAYERSPAARAKCIAHHGCRCVVCSFDFAQVYGELGRNFIHVHHIVPLSEIRREYEVDPIRDLVPICPNCHAIIHSTRPALKVEQLKGHLFGRVAGDDPSERPSPAHTVAS